MFHCFWGQRCSATQNQKYSWTAANATQHICETFRFVSAFTNVPEVASLALTKRWQAKCFSMIIYNYSFHVTAVFAPLQLQRNGRPVPQNCWLTYWVPPPSPYEDPHQPWSLSVAQSASSLHQYQCPEHPYLQTCLLHSPGTPTDSANNNQH